MASIFAYDCRNCGASCVGMAHDPRHVHEGFCSEACVLPCRCACCREKAERERTGRDTATACSCGDYTLSRRCECRFCADSSRGVVPVAYRTKPRASDTWDNSDGAEGSVQH